MHKKSRTNQIKISSGQYLSDVIDELPYNAIVYKCLTNIGATTLELISKHHSIIIEPNVPVILGKQSNKIFGVSEGVYKEDIIDYLYSDIPYKKIMVTPESFIKVKDAIEDVGMNLYEDFTVVFDECERTIQDVSYRANIILPMDDFFKFKRKTFISATPLKPSDPRFDQHEFDEIFIIPDYETAIDIDLIPTNNILLSLKQYLKSNPHDHYCIFINSTETIASVIKTLNIKDDAHVFCAKESVSKLKINGLNIASHQFDPRKVKKYNFFTSRFNSAVDLKVDFKPNVLIITDLQKALHSMVDPQTEVIQIIGRWRNGYNKVAHITNLKANLLSRTKEEVLSYLKGCADAYQTIKGLRQAATTIGARETLDQCLELVEYAKYVNPINGDTNHYMIDNEIYKNRVSGYYRDVQLIKEGYSQSKRFNLNFQPEEYPLNDIKANRLKQGMSSKLIFETVANTFFEIESAKNAFNFNGYIARAELAKQFPDIWFAYLTLGYPKIVELNFNRRAIDLAIQAKQIKWDKGHFHFISLLKGAFKVGYSYTSPKIIKALRYGIRKYGLKLNPNLSLFSEYFELSSRTTIKWNEGKEVKGYRILKSKFN